MDPLPALAPGGVAAAHIAVADGVDLGLGILFPLARRQRERDLLMRGVTPFWDGNKPWSVFGAAKLCLAGLAVDQALPPTRHLPLLAMGSALILRGLALEDPSWELRSRDLVLAGGSLVAALCQGLAMGGWVQTALTQGRHFGGNFFECLSTLGFLCAACIRGGYVLPGAGYWHCARIARRGLVPLVGAGPGTTRPGSGANHAADLCRAPPRWTRAWKSNLRQYTRLERRSITSVCGAAPAHAFILIPGEQ
jgi:hypothetical protein